MCGPKGSGLVLNRVWVLYSSLELGMLPKRSYFFIIIDKTRYRPNAKMASFKLFL